MTKSSKGILLFRATRDGFTSKAFHLKCDGKGNTITIIKNNLNYVFGGYASSAWHSSGSYTNDPNAFLFSFRRAGVSFKDQFAVKVAANALIGNTGYGPIFGGGGGNDICYDIEEEKIEDNNNNNQFIDKNEQQNDDRVKLIDKELISSITTTKSKS